MSCLQGPHQGAQKSTSTGTCARGLEHVLGEGRRGRILDDVAGARRPVPLRSALPNPKTMSLSRLPIAGMNWRPAATLRHAASLLHGSAARRHGQMRGSWPQARMNRTRSSRAMLVVAVFSSG